MARISAFVLTCLVAAAGACGDDTATEDSEDGTSSGGDTTVTSTTSPTATTSTTATSTATSTSTEGDETGFDPPVEECGNGFVEGDEECDDANLEDGDGCTSECQVVCGLQWENIELPPTDDSELRSVRVTPVGDGVVVAASLQENTADQGGGITFGNFEGWLAHYDAAGVRLWDTRLTATFDDLGVVSVVGDASDGLFVVATSDSDGLGTDIWITKLDATDGSVVWGPLLQDAPIAESSDVGTGVAVAPDGDVVVTGRIRAGDGDDDVWVGKLDADNGATVWVSTWTGVSGGEFSNDEAGPVAVSSDGTVRVLALEYVDFQTKRPTLLTFPPGGGAATSVAVPDLPAGQQAYTLFDLQFDSSDNPYLLYRQDAAAEQTYFLAKLDGSDAVAWSRTPEDIVPQGSSQTIWSMTLTDADEPILVGEVENDYELPQESWFEVWVSRRTANGDEQCYVQQQSTLEGLSRADLDLPQVAARADGSAVVAGNQRQDGDPSLWVGSFRTP